MPAVQTADRRVTVETVAPDRLDPVIDVLNQAAARLAALGVDQWPAHFHADGGRRIADLRRRAGRGEVFLIADDTSPLGTVCVSRDADPDFAPFWPSGTVADAVYLYRMAVADTARGGGIGDVMLNLARDLARIHGVRWVRADCSRTNTALHAWYRRKGFEHVATAEVPGRKSGALWQMDLHAPGRTHAERFISFR